MLKQTDKVVKVGDYYEIQSIQDMITQKITKKQDIVSTASIPQQPDNIITNLPTQKQALTSLYYSPNSTLKVQDMSLNECQSSLETLLKQPITDEERKQIQKLLKQITQIKNNGELPLNIIPKKASKQESKQSQPPKQISLKSTNLNISHLENDIDSLQTMKFLEISKLEHIVGILLGEIKGQAPQQQQQQIDQKTKEEIGSLYNSLHSLKSLNDLNGIIQTIASNQTKFIQINNWVQQLDKTLTLNKQTLQQFENDELILNQLQQNFDANISQVRTLIKQLCE